MAFALRSVGISAVPKNPQIKYPDLPVATRREEIMTAMRKHQVVIVVGETGSGKTTQLPKMAYELSVEEGSEGRVGCTQPRRLAAASVARRVASEMGTELGNRVGYQVRFVEKVQQETSIKFMTDGILLAETQRDRSLKQYSTLIIDEAHERSLNIDFVLGYLKNLLERRKDLRIVVSSATLDAGKFSEYFNGAPVVNVEGRTFPVEDHYLPPHSEGEDLSRHIARAVEWVTDMDARGDVLIFLPGEREIRECADTLEGKNFYGTEILPLFARLGLDEQERVFRTDGPNRRIVLATNVAETSVTIPGIVYVIDSGLARVSRWNPGRQIQRLQIEQISQASARQRRGRCGRVQEGICVRLYDEETHDTADEYTDPEIRRSSLAGVILRMKSLKLPDVREFPFLSPPAPKAISEGHRTLEDVDAMHKDGSLTKTGHQLARLPLDPRLGRMLIEAQQRGVLEAMLIMVGGMSVMDVRERPQEKQSEADAAHKKFNDEESDFLTLLHIWAAVSQFREKRRFKRNQLRKFCKQNFLSFRRVLEWDQIVSELRRLVGDTLKVKIAELSTERSQWGDEDEMHKCLLAGVPRQFGLWDKEKRVYRSTGGREFAVFPGSGLFGKKRPEWVIAFELVETGRVWARKVAALDPLWVEQVIPHLCRSRYHSPSWNEKQGAVYGKETVICGGLTLINDRKIFYGRVNPQEAHEVFVREALLESGLRTRGKFMDHLDALRHEVEDAEHKLRRKGGLWSDDAVYDFFHDRIPREICTAKAFQKWRTTGNNEEQLMLTVEDCVWGEIEELSDFPDVLWFKQDEIEQSYQLSYHEAPGETDDGLSIELGLEDISTFPSHLRSWAVPGMLEERVYLLIRSLPKSQRQACSPARDVAIAFCEEWHGWQPTRCLLEELSSFLSAKTGHLIEASMFNEDRLPAYLIPKLRVWSEDDEQLAHGTDIEAIKEELTGLMQDRRELQANEEWEMTGGEGWDFGTIPLKTDEGLFPALVDEGRYVGMRAFLNQQEAEQSHRAGCVRLFSLYEEKQIDFVRRQFPLGMSGKMMLPMMDPTGAKGGEWLKEEMLRIACEGALSHPLPRDEETFTQCCEKGRGELFACAESITQSFEAMLDIHPTIASWVEQQQGQRHLSDIAEDISQEVDWLLGNQYVWRAGYRNFIDYPRYFSAIEERLKRLDSLPIIKDEEKRHRIQRLWCPWYDRWKANPTDSRLWEIGWLMMEWRVSEYAPSQPRRMKVSEKKIETLLDAQSG
ncbi:MAG: ATP-dependent RNA helicase HrpA [Akkermansiaceae bacterium]